MKEGAQREGDFARMRGRNFEGFIEFAGDTLKLDLTEFKKGGSYCAEITNQALEKDPRRYLIFKRIDDLFLEFITNEDL